MSDVIPCGISDASYKGKNAPRQDGVIVDNAAPWLSLTFNNVVQDSKDQWAEE